MKAHPVLFEGEEGEREGGGRERGRERGGAKKSELHFYSSLQMTFTFKIAKPNFKVEYLKTVRDREKVSMEVR